MRRRDFFRTLAAAGLAAVARIYPGAEVVGVVAEPDPLAPAHGYVEWGVLAQWDGDAGAWHSRVIDTEDWEARDSRPRPGRHGLIPGAV